MSYGGVYNPVPPRVWSRVQNLCTYTVDSSYESVYVPFTNQNVPLAQALYQEKLYYKGNILQYKKNSSNLTKSQKYSKIATGNWVNRNKTWATQSATYSNPNTSSLKRVNSIFYPYPNILVGQPNNPAGPFETNVPNPYGCPTVVVEDGGTLLCNAYVEPCTGKVIQNTSTPLCFPTTDSDVPGQIQPLCWSNRLQTFYPRQRYTMSNSGTKFPQGYKAFVSGVKPIPPVLSYQNVTTNSVELFWIPDTNDCLPISSYQLYQDGVLIETLSFEFTKYVVENLISGVNYSFYIVSFSTTIPSEPSETIYVQIL
jgi:hypothetical protein